MKKLIALLCVGLAVGASAEVEYGTLIGNEQFVILAEGETFTVLANNFPMNSSRHLNLYYPPNSESSIGLAMNERDSYNLNSRYALESTIVGSCKIRLESTSSYCSYKITRPDAVVNTSPMNIISLPDDNNGDVDLLVESSTDLQNWTPVYSGSAGTSNNAAFFRTRLIQN